jgi:uracil-DNA glycosylase
VDNIEMEKVELFINASWAKHLKSEFSEAYYNRLLDFLTNEYSNQQVYPPTSLVFNAFNKCSFEGLKVVIIGQDPYHGSGQAHGLAFSVPDGVKLPPSLKNIFKELNADVGTQVPTSGNLEHWASQGVLLLNATLTVRAQSAGSHQKQGWEEFTDAVIRMLNQEKTDLVFLLWGAYAQKKGSMIDSNKHCILKAPHPSPFSAHTGFLGCGHFSASNAYLKSKGKQEIQW